METLMSSLHLPEPKRWEIITVVNLKTCSVLLQKIVEGDSEHTRHFHCDEVNINAQLC